MYHGTKIPTNYKTLSAWTSKQATAKHAATYASKFYKRLKKELGASRSTWSLALTYGWHVSKLLTSAPWGKEEHAEECTQYHNHHVMEWEKKGDFIYITMEWLVVAIDLRSAEAPRVWFNGARYMYYQAPEFIEAQNKARQVVECTFKLPQSTPFTPLTGADLNSPLVKIMLGNAS